MFGPLGSARDRVPDQGRELLDLIGVLDVCALHRQCDRTDRLGQAGCGLCRRLRGTGLDALGPVRWHGRNVVALQRHASDREPGLRQEPRWLRDRGRCRRARARRTRACQGAWCQNLRRGRRLRCDVGRVRHGRPIRRGRGALYAARHGGSRRHRARLRNRLHQSSRNRDAHRRRPRDRGHPGGFWLPNP